ncbi:MAG: FHA domain-containing protein [bacterium]|nr:FHA domain-containing protein [bacterium]MCX7917611.1 FHA domain-containing protein [bacterium]MDW8163876.1 FHA domain-containing protein [Candidatus Omnitrophota bacterium]
MRKEYELTKEITYIGRQNTNDISIPNYEYFKSLPTSTQRLYLDNLTKVSRIHARITKKADGWYIEDIGTTGMGSQYGTYVNMARLEVKKPYKLMDNDEIRFGPIKCIFKEL